MCGGFFVGMYRKRGGARRPAAREAGGRREAAAKPPPAAYGEAVCGAPRRCAKTLLVWAAAFRKVREGKGREKAAVRSFSMPSLSLRFADDLLCKPFCSPPVHLSAKQLNKNRPEPFGTGRCDYSQQCSQSW